MTADLREPGGASLQILTQAFEKWMPHFAFRRLRPVFDLGQQGRFDPHATMRNSFWRRAAFYGSVVLAGPADPFADAASKPWSTLPA
jgi:hypothetical protein